MFRRLVTVAVLIVTVVCFNGYANTAFAADNVQLRNLEVNAPALGTNGAATAHLTVLATITLTFPPGYGANTNGAFANVSITLAENPVFSSEPGHSCGLALPWKGRPDDGTYRCDLDLAPGSYDLSVNVSVLSLTTYSTTDLAQLGFPSHITVSSGPQPGPVQAFSRKGYWLATPNGGVYPFGDANWVGDFAMFSGKFAPKIIALLHSPGSGGYDMITSTGGNFSWNQGVTPVCFPILPPASGQQYVAAVLYPDNTGCWVFTDRGGVWTTNPSRHFGDLLSSTLNGPIISAVTTPSGNGYYMVASDGGVFCFGDAAFHGSMGGKHLNGPVVGLVADYDNVGYWLVASDGGVFSFDAPFNGSMGGRPLNKPMVGMVRYGGGYLMVAGDGGVFDFSSLPFAGSLGSSPPATLVTMITPLDE